MNRDRCAPWAPRADLALGCCVAVLAVACATQGTAVKPSRAAEERVLARVQAYETREVFDVRLNPTGCGAPPFEVRLDNLWQRVVLEPDDPTGPVGILANRLESQGGIDASSATTRIVGRLLTKFWVAPNRSPYPILIVFGECEDEQCNGKAGTESPTGGGEER